MQDVIISFLIGGVGAVIGTLGNWVLEKRKYRLAAQQLIIEKRIESLQYIYDSIQVFIEVSSVQRSEEPRDISFYYPKLLNDKDIATFKKKLETVLKNHFWYSIELKNKIIDLSNSVKCYIDVISECQSMEERKLMASRIVIEIDDLQRELQELIYRELQDISNFNSFTKENIRAIKGKT